jgi:hypothetical protein
MQFRANATSQDSSIFFYVATSYTPSQVSKITYELQWHGSQSTTPNYTVSVRKSGGDNSWPAVMNFQLWPTTDQTFTWETTDIATYMSSSGVMEMAICGCHQNTTSYDTYIDVGRIKLTLN